MENDSVSIQSNVVSIDIGNIMTNPNVVYNENNLPYATNIDIELPLNHEISPVQTSAITVTNSLEPAKLLTFDRFQDVVATPANSTNIPINNGENLIILEETSANNPNEQLNGNAITIIQNDLPEPETPDKRLFARIMKNCKYFLTDRYQNPEHFAHDIFWLNKQKGNISKIIGLSKLAASALLGVAETPDNDSQDPMDPDPTEETQFYYNGTMLLLEAEDETEVNEFVIPSGTIADQLNGNIYSSDVIDFVIE